VACRGKRLARAGKPSRSWSRIVPAMKSLFAGTFYVALGSLFINAWSQVTSGGVAASLAGVAIASALCWLIARIIKEGGGS
jgi:hypothetical protein